MQINQYYRRILMICLGLLVAIIGLSVLLLNQGPRVRLIQFSDNPAQSRFTQNTTMTISFDRPIEQKDYTDSITISPDIPFSTRTNPQGITLTFNESLAHGADYTVAVLPGIFDRSNKMMQSRYETTFTTSAPLYAYIERNYPEGYESDPVLAREADDADDHILLAELGSDPEIVYSHPEIRSFVASASHMAVVVREDDQDRLLSIETATKITTEHTLEEGGRISNLTLGSRGQVALFTVQPDFDTVGRETYELLADRVLAIDIPSGDITTLINEAGEFIKAFDIAFANDGQVALVQDASESFYAISPFNDYEPILVGTFDTAFGFNSSASEIVFRDLQEIVRYDIASGQAEVADIDSDGLIRFLSTRNNDIFAASTSFIGAIDRNTIQRYADWGSQPQVVWRSALDDTSTLSGFNQSYDNSLLAIAQNPGGCRFDAIGANSQCTSVTTQLYDTISQETVTTVNGFDLVWIP